MQSRVKIITFVLCCILALSTLGYKALAEKNPPRTLTVPATRISFFQLDSKGQLQHDQKGLPFKSQNEMYTTDVSFSPSNTAFFVVDPWTNAPSNFLNQYYGKITQTYILPLIRKAIAWDFPVYIFTNRCEDIKPAPYSCTIPKEFYAMVKKYPKVKLIHWQEIKLDAFVTSLRNDGITNLIYTGFASNMCIIGRPTGMINMLQQGFALYFIPEASAAVETEGTWQAQTIHRATTTMIAQWMAKLIKYQDISAKLQS